MNNTTTLESVTEKSQGIANDFLSHYKSKDQYNAAIRKIAEKCSGDFRNIKIDDYHEIVKYYKDTRTTDAQESYAESFFKYLYACNLLNENIEKEFALIFGNKEAIIKYFEKRKLGSKGKKKKKEPIYTFQEIERLQEYCREVETATDPTSYRNLRAAFAFYLLFYLGITKDAFRKCKMSDYHEGELFIDGKYFAVPKLYQSIFSYAKEKNRDTKFAEVNSWITRLGKELQIENLTPKRILMARKEYVFKCPMCQEECLSLADNWCVVNGKIVCSTCANELVENDVKKNVKSDLKSYRAEVLEDKDKEKIKIKTMSYKKINYDLKNTCDFETLNKYLKLVGQIGEKFVYDQEVQKLLNAGQERLAELVDPLVALDHRNGFDILSYTETGKKLHIEVKATGGDLNEPFYMSKNEIDKAEELKNKGEIYRIYRVYNVGKESINYEIIENTNQHKREEVLYKFSFIDQEG